MNRVLQFLALLCVFGATTPARAQIVNGEFESGPAGWTWKTAMYDGGTPGASCDTLLAPFAANYTQTPTNIMGPDRAALIITSPSYFVGTSYGCREIEQTVTVPVGSKLRMQHLVDTSGNYIRNGASITVTLEDIQTGIKAEVYRKSTQSDPANIDVSKFWGRNVYLRIRGVTSTTGDTLGVVRRSTPAWIDGVRFEPIVGYAAPPDDGGWYNPERSGQGLHISKAPDGQLVVMWYTFLSNGNPVWYMTDIAPFQNSRLRAPMRKFTWNAALGRSVGEMVGDIEITTASFDEKTIYFQWDFHANGDIPGFDGGERMVWLSGDEGYTGLWYEPALSGWGFSVDHETGSSAATALFYFDGVEPVWAYSVIQQDPVAGVTSPLLRYTSTGLCPQCQFLPVSRTPTVVGQIGLQLNENKAWFNTTGTYSNWTRGTSSQPVALGRLTFPN